MGTFFFEITVIICLAAVLAVIFRILKQPPILAYILAGIILGPLGVFHLESKVALESLAEIGIALLLFTLALELKLSGLRSVGATVLIVGTGQVVLTALGGFLISLLLGFSSITAGYIAVALTFSSTIIIVKLLTDKKELNSLHGKITVGALLLQDFFAVLILIVLSAFHGNSSALSGYDFLVVMVKCLLLFSTVLFLSNSIVPHLIDKIAKSQELLFLFSLGWVFGISAFVSSPIIGFPIEIGGFLAGLSLANSHENFQIASRVRGLRDFFITIFFVMLGIGMTLTNMTAILFPAFLLLLFVLIGKPLMTIVITGFLGYRKRTSFLVGISLGQISEFSLIIVFLGYKLGHISADIVTLLTVVAIASFTSSTYVLQHANYVYKKLAPVLSHFEIRDVHTKHDIPHAGIENLDQHIALIGGHEMGKSILESLKDGKDEIIVIDFDPDIVSDLKEKGIMSLFGDIADLDIQEKAKLHQAKLIISTVPDVTSNLELVKELSKKQRSAKLVVIARDKHDAKLLYAAGADYVVMPFVEGGKHLAKIIKEDRLDQMEAFKAKDLAAV